MKKALKGLLLCTALTATFAVVSACGKDKVKDTPTTSETSYAQSSSEETKQKITGVIFSGAEFVYDGTEKSIVAYI